MGVPLWVTEELQGQGEKWRGTDSEASTRQIQREKETQEEI